MWTSAGLEAITGLTHGSAAPGGAKSHHVMQVALTLDSSSSVIVVLGTAPARHNSPVEAESITAGPGEWPLLSMRRGDDPPAAGAGDGHARQSATTPAPPTRRHPAFSGGTANLRPAGKSRPTRLIVVSAPVAG